MVSDGAASQTQPCGTRCARVIALLVLGWRWDDGARLAEEEKKLKGLHMLRKSAATLLTWALPLPSTSTVHLRRTNSNPRW